MLHLVRVLKRAREASYNPLRNQRLPNTPAAVIMERA
jgi:hypothetical protein